ncbi:unnamed protein product [Pedinophyceae sp. YPF-701]|nr:unnamed protein product [Pedinophyceae sp. YPF-701]
MEERAERMRGNPYAKRRPVNSPPRVVVEDGATVERAPLRGPVYVRVHTHTHSHSTAMRHDTRTKLLQSWHVGMCGAPAELNARALGSELDYQMHLTDCALTLLNAKMRAHKEKLAGEPGNELATVVLR